MARLPDPARSRAVLIGTAAYQNSELPALPAIANNLRDLAALLTELSGFSDCVVVSDPAEPSHVGRVLGRASSEAEDVLLLYYSGHGLLDSRGDLYLGLTGTEVDSVSYTALPYSAIQDTVRNSAAQSRIVILDCSFSGRAATGSMDADTGFGKIAVASGVFVLASTPASQHAFARSGEPYTAFTGELIRLLSQGIAGGTAVVTLDDIYQALHTRMIGLGYPRPHRLSTDTVGQVGLVRNRAYEPGRETGQASEEPPRPTEAVDDRPADIAPTITESKARDEDEDLEWFNDAPANIDLLQRAPIAALIGMRLVETHSTHPGTSFLMHLDGPWGSGKSTLLNLLDQRISSYFRVVRFDAWQQSRFAPSWWSLLTALRAEVTCGRPWWKRPFMRFREAGARIQRTGAPYGLALLVVTAFVSICSWALWPANSGSIRVAEVAKAATAVVAVLATLSAGTLLAARLFLWDSVRGARLFEQTQTNPMADIAAHFRWLLKRSDKPVAFFIDDLDRCDQKYVVDLLDTVQTLVRGMGDSKDSKQRAAYFLVAADGAWLRRSYETAHDAFADMLESGAPLGYLFLDKFFQLTLPMPALTGAARTSYLDQVLRIEDPSSTPEAPLAQERTSRSDGGLMDRLRKFEEGRAQSVLAAFSTPAERRRTEHTLRKFASVLGDNPRAVKKFINTYSIVRSIRFLEDIHVDPDALALWSLVAVRWPNIARHLTAHPEAVAGIADPLWCSDHFPEALRAAATSEDLRAVVTSPHGGPLTPVLIRQCCGSHTAQT